MSELPLHSIETAPAAAKPLLEKAQKNYGFVPNLLGVMSNAPALLEAYMTLSGIFGKTSLSPTEQQVVTMTVARLNDCHYCIAAHTTVAQMSNVSSDVLDGLRSNTPLADAKLEALRQFTIKVVEKKGWVDAADQKALTDAGYDAAVALEVVVGTALKALSNYTNHIADTPVDDSFAANSWSPDQAKVA